jgi:O-antigen/teichoic acid export membrane protein
MLKNLRQVLARRQNVRAHFWQSLANYTQAGSGMLLGIVLARLLEPSVFGEFVFITASLGFLMIPVSFSTAQLLISDAGETPDLFRQVWGLATLVCIVKSILAVSFVAYWFWRGEATRAQISGLVGIPMVFSDYLVALRYDLEGRGRFKPNFFAQVIDIFIQASISITLVLNGYGIYGLAWGGLIGTAVQASYYTLLSGREISPALLPPSLLIRQIQAGFWLWLSSVSSNWYSRVDKILLGHFGGPAELGYYNRAMNYGPVSHILLNSLMTNAAIRSWSCEQSAKRRRVLFFKTMALLVTAACGNGLFWHFFAEPLVPLIFGAQWQPAAKSFSVLGWLGVPYAFLFGSAALLYSYRRYTAIALVQAASLILLVSLLWLKGLGSILTSIDSAFIFCASMMAGGLVMLTLAIGSLFRRG